MPDACLPAKKDSDVYKDIDILEITINNDDLKKIVEQGMLAPDSMELKAAKYILIELA